MRPPRWIGFAVLLAGCPDDGETPTPTPTAALASLSTSGGCGNVSMYQLSEDQTLALTFQATSTLPADAFASGQTETARYDLATEASLEVWEGTALGNLLCNDFLTGDESKDVVWSAVSGTVDLSVTSTTQDCQSYDCGADATITITAATLQAPGEDDLVIEQLSWTAGVGWLPG